MNTFKKTKNEVERFEPFLQQDTKQIIKDFGIKPTIELNSRTDQNKEINIVGKVDIGDKNIPM